MKTLTITRRIIIGFAILVALSAGMGTAAWISMRSIESSAENVSTDSVPGLATSAEVMQNLARAHLILIRHVLSTNLEEKAAYEGQLKEISGTLTGLYDKLDKLCNSPEERGVADKMKQARQNYLATRVSILQLSDAGKNEEALAKLLDAGRAAYGNYDDLVTNFNAMETKAATESAGAIMTGASHSRFVLGTVVLAELAASILLAGVVITGLNRVLRRVSGSLNDSAYQVASAAGQVSTSSQSLAEGSSEQAASIEETSSSLEELASMTKRNAENAQKSNDLAKQARHAADKGVEDMQAMNQAMEAIKVSSDDIAKIIKTIDEIAFQTNILALNAAVEAARAGEAGMGFAVVADEVRNLAQRSAQAAKETAAKIEGAISKTAQGVELSGKVSQTLNEIVTKARQVDELAAEVAGASREQTQGITQINTAVGQMDKVVQSNAASAEESAAAAEELNAQAELMKESVHELMELVGGARTALAASAAPAGSRVAVSLPSLARPGKSLTNGHQPVVKKAAGKMETAARRGEIPMGGDFKDF
jgi:methyl-accepting chemotaxis protein